MDKRYEDLLGVCSHELYHTWNIKAIRPKEMLPYNYTKENYFRTGFVAEGVTTYMGDLMHFLGSLCIFNWVSFSRGIELNHMLLRNDISHSLLL